MRDWLHVDDHCRGIQLVLTGGRAGEVYNIGGGTELTNKDLTAKLLDATGTDWDRVERVTDRLGHDRRYSVDITKISDELGYQPRGPVRAGSGRDGRVVPLAPRLVGAAQAPRTPSAAPGRSSLSSTSSPITLVEVRACEPRNPPHPRSPDPEDVSPCAPSWPASPSSWPS